ncbi:hypothetical protein, partial [Asticcacaulis taihuensis]|uniref:hypothetical protein n=1 Tax=Asticcacaulis taihuensis TaxID=260084 RepID=UPI003F7B71A4
MNRRKLQELESLKAILKAGCRPVFCRISQLQNSSNTRLTGCGGSLRSAAPAEGAFGFLRCFWFEFFVFKVFKNKGLTGKFER